MKRFLTSLALAAALAAASAGAFTLEEYQFDSPAQQAEFRELIGKLRCLVCQNESLAASQADLAKDLRDEVYKMLRAGKSHDEVLDFLVERYGDFVLYEPPLKPSTYVLWFGPFILIGIGAVFMVRALLRKKATPEADLTDAEHARLADLLANPGTPKDHP